MLFEWNGICKKGKMAALIRLFLTCAWWGQTHGSAPTIYCSIMGYMGKAR